MHRATPTTDAIPVHTCEQALRHDLKQLLGLHVGLVQAFGDTVQLLSAATADCKIFRKASGAEKICSSDERFVFFVKSGDNRLAKVRAESLSIQHGRDELEAGLGGDVALFAQIVPTRGH